VFSLEDLKTTPSMFAVYSQNNENGKVAEERKITPYGHIVTIEVKLSSHLLISFGN
jgi:hypothetical protein